MVSRRLTTCLPIDCRSAAEAPSALGRPIRVPDTFSPYGMSNSRCSPIRHSGTLTSCALGGGSLTNVARGVGPEVGTGVGVGGGSNA